MSLTSAASCSAVNSPCRPGVAASSLKKVEEFIRISRLRNQAQGAWRGGNPQLRVCRSRFNLYYETQQSFPSQQPKPVRCIAVGQRRESKSKQNRFCPLTGCRGEKSLLRLCERRFARRTRCAALAGSGS